MDELKKEGVKKETETGYTVLLEDFLDMNEAKRNEFRSEFCYQSNLIEGIKSPIHVIETMDVGAKSEWPHVLGDHFSAFDYMLANFKDVLKEENIRNLHFILMHNLFKKPKKYAGKYRECKIWVGGKGGPYYKQIPKLMKNLELDICRVESQNSWQEELWNIHHEFETIHPFVDGNGRTGRLILNWLSLKHLGMFNVVTLEKRKKYYETIRSYKEDFKRKNPNVRFYKDRILKPRKPILEIKYVADFD
jgi:Fic family protein